MVGDVHDVIKCANLKTEIFMGYDFTVGSIFFRFSYLLSASLYVSEKALIEIGCVVTSLVVGRWLSRACTVAKRCILGL